MPDYVNGITILASDKFTIENDGFLYIYGQNEANADFVISIDGVDIHICSYSSGIIYGSVFLPVSAGTIIKRKYGAYLKIMLFRPVIK